MINRDGDDTTLSCTCPPTYVGQRCESKNESITYVCADNLAHTYIHTYIYTYIHIYIYIYTYTYTYIYIIALYMPLALFIFHVVTMAQRW